MLVLDASVALAAVLVDDGLGRFGRHELVAPPLLWSECRSVLHEKAWRGEIPAALAITMMRRVDAGRIHRREHEQLSARAWAIADEFGWAKTYDAEYVALAMLLECRLVTADSRLRRSADRLGIVVGPTEL